MDRGKFLADVFNPTVDAANANVAKANAHLDDINRASGAATSAADINAGQHAFSEYRPTADKAYRFGVDALALRPAIMATPIAPCSPPPPPVVAAAPSPPPRSAPVAQPTPTRVASDARAAGHMDSTPVQRAVGPRRTIGVGAIEARGGFEKDEDWSAGNALSSLLSKALSDTGQFLVVERTSMQDLLNEVRRRLDPCGRR